MTPKATKGGGNESLQSVLPLPPTRLCRRPLSTCSALQLPCGGPASATRDPKSQKHTTPGHVQLQADCTVLPKCPRTRWVLTTKKGKNQNLCFLCTQKCVY